MAQKKKKQRPPSQYKKAAEPAPAPADNMDPKALILLLVSGIVIVLSFVTIFSAARYGYGTMMYRRMQMGAYGGLALAGGLIAWSSQYNHTRSHLNVKMVGIVFAMMGICYIIGLLVNG